MGNTYLIILDGVGCGAQEDAVDYGDIGSNTLGHTIAQTRVELPNLEKLGLGNIIPLDTISPVKSPLASYGKMREVSAGKDSTTGHWEIAGIHIKKAFPTYKKGFPDEVINRFLQKTGNSNVLANAPYSGTDVIDTFGEEHLKTKAPIVYTSADSVFQIATHTDVISLEKLYEWCEITRNEVMRDDHNVGRVIARPFKGEIGSFERISEKRKDYSAIPPTPNLLTLLQERGVDTISVGKVVDLFDGIGINRTYKTGCNAEGISQILSLQKELSNAFVFGNLIDFDQLYGHRNDPVGFAGSLREFDHAIPAILKNLKKDDLLIITADHGNDPTSSSSDHAREFVPVMMINSEFRYGKYLGTRETFSDVAATVLHYFGVDETLPGHSMY